MSSMMNEFETVRRLLAGSVLRTNADEFVRRAEERGIVGLKSVNDEDRSEVVVYADTSEAFDREFGTSVGPPEGWVAGSALDAGWRFG